MGVVKAKSLGGSYVFEAEVALCMLPPPTHSPDIKAIELLEVFVLGDGGRDEGTTATTATTTTTTRHGTTTTTDALGATAVELWGSRWTGTNGGTGVRRGAERLGVVGRTSGSTITTTTIGALGACRRSRR